MSFLSDDMFTQFRDKIYAESGIHFSSVNRPILESRVRERIRKIHIATPEEYFLQLNRDNEELIILLDAVTTNLTKFFRNENHFKTLREIVFPDIIKRKANDYKRKIKIWSAGCSTGEEPYTILIVLLELLTNQSTWTVDVIASDISLKSLMIAKEGIYSADRVENIPQVIIDKYFVKKNDQYQVIDKLRETCRFDYHNLKYDHGERDIDIIFCRNVIIYFDRQAQEEVIRKFEDSLNDEGYLFIGHSESLFGMKSGFKFHKLGEACVYRKK